MTVKVSIGEKLYHKYLGLITITDVGDNGIKADSGFRGKQAITSSYCYSL